jgi:hypothetical protein
MHSGSSGRPDYAAKITVQQGGSRISSSIFSGRYLERFVAVFNSLQCPTAETYGGSSLSDYVDGRRMGARGPREDKIQPRTSFEMVCQSRTYFE